jgi:8-oxo-dGTP pyrophosphatase MutT (NUDIX family)
MTSLKTPTPGGSLLPTRLAQVFKKIPLLTDAMHLVLFLTQPRFTAGVIGVVYNDNDEVLVVEHAFHPRHAWGLPGGWLAPGESPPLGLKRELKEELGLDAEIICPLAIETGYFLKSHLDIAYLCRSRGDIGGLSYELVSYRWVSARAIPELLAFHQLAVEAAESVRPRYA